MGRQFPEQTHHHHLLHHHHPSLIRPILSLSLFITSMAAILALLTSLCAVWKKPTTPTTEESIPTQDDDNNNFTADEQQDTANSNDQFAVATPSSPPHSPPQETDDENAETQKALPLPPGMMTGTALPADYKRLRTKSMASISAAASASSKKMTLTSLGNKVMQAKRENEMRNEDSLWKKRIILGDKCKGPNLPDQPKEQESSNPSLPHQ